MVSNNSADNEVAEEEEEDYYNYDASSQQATFNMNINVSKYYMHGAENFLAFMLVIVLALLPYGYRVLKDRKSANARFGIGFFSAALSCLPIYPFSFRCY